MKRIWLWLPWALFVAIALAWMAYWNVVADTAERRLHAWASEQESAGASASIGRIVRHGFPVLMRLELHDLHYAPARGGWRASTERVDLNVEMLNPAHVIFAVKAPIAIARADGAVTTLNADTVIASWRTAHGALAVAGVEADNLTLDDPAQPGVLAARKLVINVRPDPRAVGEYQIAFETHDMTLPRPVRSFESFGLAVPTLRAAIVIEHAAALAQSSPQDPLGPWREAGGRLRFEALQLHWGPLEASGHGQGGLDAQRRIEGALELPIEHPAPVFIAIANGANIDASAKRALNLLATGYALSGDDIKLDVEARDGVLRLEGFAVRTLPPAY